MIYHIVTLAFLTVNSITDLKNKRVYLVVSVAFAIAGIIVNIIFRRHSLISILLSLGIGVILIIISKVTREAIGMGDGIIILVLGVLNGAYENLLISLYGFLISFLVSAFLLITRKFGRKDKIPFIPCLLAGYIITLI
jgi:leader peptidase (prepilin peptidase)/N-methyltransferase